MPLIPANQAQLVRSSQKDEHYRSFIKNNVNEVFQSVAGESYTLSEQITLRTILSTTSFKCLVQCSSQTSPTVMCVVENATFHNANCGKSAHR